MSSISSQQPSTLYVVYNANSTLLGKLNYVYRKMRCPDPATNPACAACELTHGPSLSLNESAEWKATKSKIINANIVQVHLDERSNSLIQWMKQHGVGTPAVIIEAASGMIGVNGEPFKILLGPEDISRVRTDHEEFLRMLQARITAAGLQNVKVDVA